MSFLKWQKVLKSKKLVWILQIEDIQNQEFEQISENPTNRSDYTDSQQLRSNITTKQGIKKSNQNHTIQHDSAFSCDKCDKQYCSSRNLKRHKQSTHEGVTHPCDQCSFKTNHLESLRQHEKSVHEKVKYPCDQCNYQATTSGNLQRHIESVHEGIKYPCEQCNYKATQTSNLQQHIKSVHDGVKYPCE